MQVSSTQNSNPLEESKTTEQAKIKPLPEFQKLQIDGYIYYYKGFCFYIIIIYFSIIIKNQTQRPPKLRNKSSNSGVGKNAVSSLMFIQIMTSIDSSKKRLHPSKLYKFKRQSIKKSIVHLQPQRIVRLLSYSIFHINPNAKPFRQKSKTS